MGTIAIEGAADFAPVYVPDEKSPPSWAGKSVFELTRQEIDAINTFCVDEAWEMGYDDAVDNTPRDNPFHRRFLHGVPCALFALHYRRGSMAASGTGLHESAGVLFAAA